MIDLKKHAVSEGLFDIARHGSIDIKALKRGLEISKYKPDDQEWMNFISKLFLFLGTGFLVSGIIFFFAYNWYDLHKAYKFALLESLLVASIMIIYFKKIDSMTGKAILIFSIILTGALFAVYGQTYQTGADSYLLFTVWAVLVSGWAAISRFLPAWTILIILVNTAFILFWEQTISSRNDSPIMLTLILFLINIFPLILFEIYNLKNIDWLSGRWFPRMMFIGIISILSFSVFEYIFSYRNASNSDIFNLFAPFLFTVFVSSAIYIYSGKIKDLFLVAVVLLSLIIVITAFLGKLMLKGEEASFILLAVLVICEGAGAGFWLKGIHNSWEDSHE